MRRGALGALGVLLVAVSLSVGAPAGAASPGIVVTPNAGLVDQQAVTVVGSGFTAGQDLTVTECPTDPAEEVWCHELGRASVGPDGGFTVVVGVVARIVQRAGPLDCRTSPGRCSLHVVQSGVADLADVVLDFDPDAPLAATPTLRVRPNHGLVDGQSVVISGAGFRPGAEPIFRVCDADAWPTLRCAHYWYGPGDHGVVGADGTLVAGFRVRARWQLTPRVRMDCRIAHCLLTAIEEGTEAASLPSVPLRMDPAGNLAPPPHIEVLPATDLVDGQVVRVRGTGWFAGENVRLVQCARPVAGHVGGCRSWRERFWVVGGDGTLHARFTVHDSMNTWSGDHVDCTLRHCALVAVRDEHGVNETTRQRITFRVGTDRGSSPAAGAAGGSPTEAPVGPAFAG